MEYDYHMFFKIPNISNEKPSVSNEKPSISIGNRRFRSKNPVSQMKNVQISKYLVFQKGTCYTPA